MPDLAKGARVTGVSPVMIYMFSELFPSLFKSTDLARQ